MRKNTVKRSIKKISNIRSSRGNNDGCKGNQDKAYKD